VTKRTISIESWQPDYGGSAESAVLSPSDIKINADVEMPASEWRPIVPGEHETPESIAVIDGVRRIDAYAWLMNEGQPPVRSLLGSVSAGAVVIRDNKAAVTETMSERCLISAAETDDLDTKAGRYTFHLAASQEPEQLTATIQLRLSSLEISIADRVAGAVDLVIIDGPLRGRQNLSNAVGYIKSHLVAYLPPELQSIIGKLKAGERTPVFFFTTSWSRYSWYMRLPGPADYDWWGIVRLEAAESLKLDEVTRLADLVTATLPRFASVVHKDPRAPKPDKVIACGNNCARYASQ
jgi:hypothetical protein